MNKRLLGGFEQAVLLAILQQGSLAYAVPVRGLLEEHLGRPVSRGAVYTALDRLEARHFVRSRMGEPISERGGRARRYYEVTVPGIAALRTSRELLESLWGGLEGVLGEGAVGDAG